MIKAAHTDKRFVQLATIYYLVSIQNWSDYTAIKYIGSTAAACKYYHLSTKYINSNEVESLDSGCVPHLLSCFKAVEIFKNLQKCRIWT